MEPGGRTLLRPRTTVVAVSTGHAALGALALIAGCRRDGAPRAAWTVVALLCSLAPVGVLLGSRVRALSIGPAGIHLRGVLLDHRLRWADVTAVGFCRLGPTTFLVARTNHGQRQPRLSPFRPLFARRLGVRRPRSLLVIRAVDFPGGHPAVRDLVGACAPPHVRLAP